MLCSSEAVDKGGRFAATIGVNNCFAIVAVSTSKIGEYPQSERSRTDVPANSLPQYASSRSADGERLVLRSPKMIVRRKRRITAWQGEETGRPRGR